MRPRPTLILLHGSRGTCQELLPLAQAMADKCTPMLPNLLGHGGRPIPDSFTVRAMASDILEQMDSQGISTAYLFGYSFGGYLALYLARHAPERILGVCTLATKFVFDRHTVALFTQLSSVDRILNRQRALMDQRHPGQDWSRLVNGLADLYRRLGQTPALTDADLEGITIPTLTISANNDQLVPWLESLKVGYLMPKGQGFTFAGKAHPLEVVPVPFLAAVVGKWLESVSSRRTP